MALASLELGDLSATIKSMYHHTQIDDYCYIFLYFYCGLGGLKPEQSKALCTLVLPCHATQHLVPVTANYLSDMNGPQRARQQTSK